MPNINKNKPIIKEPIPLYNGVQILKILHVTIGEDSDSYNCIMGDGTIKNVPMEFFEIEKEGT